jgi:F420-dependent oxidoreductase-like protein
VKVGVIVPQGWTKEYAGWNARAAWSRSVEIAVAADRLGFDSIWAFDHFHTTPDASDDITFESFAFLAGLAGHTRRVRLGHIVACGGYRNPALLAKAISTLDVISGGRMELGIGAGWKEDEWRAYGYGFPPTRERLRILADQLEVIERMLAPGRATFDGRYASVNGAINEPPGLQGPRIPIMVGGNGRQVTWRLAARHADELNLDAMPPADVQEALPVIAERCIEIGRDPATLRVSVHIWWELMPASQPAMTALLREYADLGISRVQTLARTAVTDIGALQLLAEAAVDAGVEMDAQIEMDGGGG